MIMMDWTLDTGLPLDARYLLRRRMDIIGVPGVVVR